MAQTEYTRWALIRIKPLLISLLHTTYFLAVLQEPLPHAIKFSNCLISIVVLSIRSTISLSSQHCKIISPSLLSSPVSASAISFYTVTHLTVHNRAESKHRSRFQSMEQDSMIQEILHTCIICTPYQHRSILVPPQVVR